MKKISVLLLAVMMLFAFTACDNEPNKETPIISNEDLAVAKDAYKAVIDDINSKTTTAGTDDPESAAGGEQTLASFTSGDKSYSVKYNLSYTFKDNWSVTITVSADGYSMEFTATNSSTEITVTVGDKSYKVAAATITAGNTITGTVTADDDEEEQVPPEDGEEESTQTGGDNEGTDGMAPVDP